MTGTGPDLDASPTSDLDDEFLALVCSDEDLLDAEFQAIVAGLEPPRQPAAPPGSQRGRGAGAQPSAPSRGQGSRQLAVRRPTTGRERSPPKRRGRQP